MIVGLPKEVKNNEHRVGLTPDSVKQITESGHEVYVETNCGKEIGFTNDKYEAAGANILNTPSEVYEKSELIVKVKEPMESEIQYLNSDITLFTYLHLAGNPSLAKKIIDTGNILFANFVSLIIYQILKISIYLAINFNFVIHFQFYIKLIY